MFSQLNYDKIPIWENKRRIAKLEQFIHGINQYYGRLGIHAPYNIKTELQRTALSQSVTKIYSIVQLGNAHPTEYGEDYRGRLNLIENVTRLDEKKNRPSLIG
jgi:hypothetical protein